MPRLRTPKGHVLALPPRRVSVGESAANEIPIAPGNGVAGVHFHLQPWESGYFLEDAGSGLGTLVNGDLVKWAPLHHGDIITAGELKMIYESEEGPELPAFPTEVGSSPEVPGAGTLRPPEAPPPPQQPPQQPQQTQQQPPSWLPPEALLPPVSPIAQAAARRDATVERMSPRRLLAIVLLCGAALAAAWYFFFR